jgi:hypothetical protein
MWTDLLTICLLADLKLEDFVLDIRRQRTGEQTEGSCHLWTTCKRMGITCHLHVHHGQCK